MSKLFCRAKLFLLLSVLIFSNCTNAFASVSTNPYDKLEKLYSKGKYENVLKHIKILEKRRFGENGSLNYTLRNDVLYYHLKLSSKLKLNPKGPLKESIGLYKRLIALDSTKQYINEPHYKDFLNHIKSASEVAYKKNQLDMTRYLVGLLAVNGDTTLVYRSVYPTKETLHLATNAALREFLKEYDYTEIDKRALNVKKQTSIDNQVLALIKDYKYDFEKVRAIYIWIINNISYDYSYTIYEGYNTFKSGKGVCSGFSYLFKEMCQKAGVKTYRVTGFAYGSPPGYHAWNSVELQGYPFLIESTWASSIKERTNYYYLIDEKDLAKTHKEDKRE
jgi:transglutaminase/protease-like cytokinesis protein 3